MEVLSRAVIQVKQSNFHRILLLFHKSNPLIIQMCFTRRIIAYLCPNTWLILMGWILMSFTLKKWYVSSDAQCTSWGLFWKFEVHWYYIDWKDVSSINEEQWLRESTGSISLETGAGNLEGSVLKTANQDRDDAVLATSAICDTSMLKKLFIHVYMLSLTTIICKSLKPPSTKKKKRYLKPIYHHLQNFCKWW